MKTFLANICLFSSIILLSYFRFALCSEEKKEVCIKSVCVSSEVADTDDKRTKGLMFRDGLAQNSGMLFIFEEEGRYGFWMKNMKFPLDMIWIDKNKKIIDISKNVPVCAGSCSAIIPQARVMYVLEVKSGFADTNRIEIGEDVSFK